jgi:hypothetical protein
MCKALLNLDKHIQTGAVLTWRCAAKEALYPLKGGETTGLMRYGSAWRIESFAGALPSRQLQTTAVIHKAQR